MKVPNTIWVSIHDWIWDPKKTDNTDLEFVNAKEFKQFQEAVVKMRKSQKDYFRTRSDDALALSKHRESIVDSLLTPKLFEE